MWTRFKKINVVLVHINVPNVLEQLKINVNLAIIIIILEASLLFVI